ncbi:potassium transporter Kup [Chitinibacteraceae bacterium HSL-7]
MSMQQQGKSALPALAVAAIGVVYGDIGTSPLYTLKEVFNGHVPLALTPFNVVGILSLVFWGLMMVVSVKYVSIVLRADNRGEGGILALMALAMRAAHGKPALLLTATLCGLFGAALFYGEVIITPAISVLSALEGLSVVTHTLDHYIVPLAIVLMVALFAVQSHGTAVVGKLFGPVMLLWFITLAVLGIISIVQTPEVLMAINPWMAVRFFAAHPWISFVLLGAVVLCITGAEALYADMGHFGRPAIRIAWFGLVLPSLLLNYFGQGALLLRTPEAIKNPFFLLAPDWALLPLVGLATVATIIASQAVISGAYSMTSQAIQLGFLPRFNVRHTSDREIGQIYIPQVNWLLLAAVVVLLMEFRTSSNLAAAYGLSVTMTMVMTSVLAFIVFGKRLQGRARTALFALLALLITIDITLVSANLLKLPHGGWLPLLIGLIVFTVMRTWKQGRVLLYERLRAGEMPLAGFVEALEDGETPRVAGTSVFMTASSDSVPHALLHNLKHNKVLHEQVIFLTLQTADEPYVPSDERVVVRRLGQSFFQVIVTYGFKQEPDVPAALAQAARLQPGLEVDEMMTSYFLSRETIVESQYPAMSWWRRRLFSLMSRNAMRATAFFKIPPNRVVEMGMQVDL